MRSILPPAVPQVSGEAAGRHLERAQAVWQAAVELADGTAGDGSGVALELLRTADFDPSTLSHALTLGHTHLRRRPYDDRHRRARQLLRTTIDWLGVPAADGEVGSASAGRRTPGTPPSRSRAARSGS